MAELLEITTKGGVETAHVKYWDGQISQWKCVAVGPYERKDGTTIQAKTWHAPCGVEGCKAPLVVIRDVSSLPMSHWFQARRCPEHKMTPKERSAAVKAAWDALPAAEKQKRREAASRRYWDRPKEVRDAQQKAAAMARKGMSLDDLGGRLVGAEGGELTRKQQNQKAAGRRWLQRKMAARRAAQ